MPEDIEDVFLGKLATLLVWLEPAPDKPFVKMLCKVVLAELNSRRSLADASPVLTGSSAAAADAAADEVVSILGANGFKSAMPSRAGTLKR